MFLRVVKMMLAQMPMSFLPFMVKTEIQVENSFVDHLFHKDLLYR